MRIAFIETITDLAKKDPNIYLVTGDLGFSVFEDFKKRFPKQFINVGVAEQNMIGVSAGLAMTGKRVFVYSISTFATLRPYEQIRNDLSYQNLPVVIVGGGSTFSYSTFGSTHQPLEDLGALRLLPNMAVMATGDPLEVRALLKEAIKAKHPSYIRIAKRGEPIIHSVSDKIKIGKIITVRKGKDITLICNGRVLADVVQAAKVLADSGVSARVLDAHTIKPFDEKTLLKAVKETKAIISIEEHNVLGGLGTVVAETLALNNVSIPLTRLGIPDEFPAKVGMQNYFLKRYKLDVGGIVETATVVLGKK
jgi:transketolase